MKISKEQFTELAKEHLIALESFKIDKNGNKTIKIFGIEKLYEAINVTCSHEKTTKHMMTGIRYCSNPKCLKSVDIE